MELAKRTSKLGLSPTLALNAKAKKLAEEGKIVVNLTVGEPDYDTPLLIVEAAKKALDEGQTRYGPAGGSLKLQQAIAKKLFLENKIEIAPDNIVCGIGAKELLFHIFLSILNEGD